MFASKVTHESKAVPGVKFTVRHLNSIQRARRDEKLIDARIRYADLTARRDAILERSPDDPTNPERKLIAEADRAELTRLTYQLEYEIDIYFKPAYILAGLISIDGYRVDEAAVTSGAQLLESGHDALIEEVHRGCVEAGGLSSEQTKNSQPSGISSEAAAPGGTNSTATAASDTANM